ncbi:tetratricopeptide repeat protein [Oleiharenicola sp. Vm1]|uniref:tetratricopeptide repeat protein n=1 Tax=Oleiharenicola sp. Vm1 TaxID=3398393 RepID=UPI0039F5E0F2
MTEQSVASLEPRLQKLVESARAAFARGDFAHATALAREVLAVAPGCLPVRQLERAAQLKRGPGRFLARVVGRLMAAPLLLRGHAVRAKDPAGALACAQAALERDPHGAAGLRLLGRTAAALGWRATAVFAFEALCAETPGDPANLIALGRAQLEAGRADAAVRCAEAVLAREPIHGAAQALRKDAAVAQTMAAGHWEEGGDFRTKVKA